mmetsp:Transcript_92706/g.181649  ORF Transcript_92706/g.181649 Transcript_92706/m.181649 type:complete len:218 (-) Transcript_92706:524-1177(-)
MPMDAVSEAYRSRPRPPSQRRRRSWADSPGDSSLLEDQRVFWVRLLVVAMGLVSLSVVLAVLAALMVRLTSMPVTVMGLLRRWRKRRQGRRLPGLAASPRLDEVLAPDQASMGDADDLDLILRKGKLEEAILVVDPIEVRPAFGSNPTAAAGDHPSRRVQEVARIVDVHLLVMHVARHKHIDAILMRPVHPEALVPSRREVRNDDLPSRSGLLEALL